MTEKEIRRGLEALGVRPGQAVVVHGSLKSLGHVEGGAAAVAAAIADLIGPAGLVTMPVYAMSVDREGDLLRTPDPGARVTTGAIPAAFARRPDVRLAAHPLYSFAFYGTGAEELARKCERLLLPYGKDQPLHCLRARKGLILQLGTDETTNTSMHVAEELADPRYLAEKKSVSKVTVESFFALPVEERREILAKHRTGPRRDFRKATPLLERAGLRRTVQIGPCRAALTDFEGLLRLVIREIELYPLFLIRTSPI